MKNTLPRIIIGTSIIAIGAMLLLDSLGLPNFGNILGTWWPIFIIVAGLASLIGDPRNFVWPVAIIALGVLLQFDQLDMLDFNPWRIVWPAILITIGVSVIFNQSGQNVKRAEKSERQNITAILGGGSYINDSNDFKGAKITALMGAAELDISNSTIKNEATIEVMAVMGGVELRVPAGVTVKNHTRAVLGGTEVKTRAPKAAKSPVINIVGDIIMGGLEVKD